MLLSDLEKLCVIMSESNLAFITAKTCFYILQRRRDSTHTSSLSFSLLSLFYIILL